MCRILLSSSRHFRRETSSLWSSGLLAFWLCKSELDVSELYLKELTVKHHVGLRLQTCQTKGWSTSIKNHRKSCGSMTVYYFEYGFSLKHWKNIYVSTWICMQFPLVKAKTLNQCMKIVMHDVCVLNNTSLTENRLFRKCQAVMCVWSTLLQAPFTCLSHRRHTALTVFLSRGFWVRACPLLPCRAVFTWESHI